MKLLNLWQRMFRSGKMIFAYKPKQRGIVRPIYSGTLLDEAISLFSTACSEISSKGLISQP